MKKLIVIIMCLICITGCETGSTDDLSDNLNEMTIEQKKEKENEYKKIILDFMKLFISPTSFEEVDEFVEKNMNSEGVFAWQDCNDEIVEFEKKYERVENNYESPQPSRVPEDEQEKLEFIRNEMENRIKGGLKIIVSDTNATYFDFFSSSSIDIEQKNKVINVVSTKLNISAKGEDLPAKLFEFIFYQDKLIDIRFKEEDDSITSLFVGYNSKWVGNIRQDIRYLQKKTIFSDILSEIVLNKNGEFFYIINTDIYVKNSKLMRQYNLYGTYVIKPFTLEVTATHWADGKINNDLNTFDSPMELKFTHGGRYIKIGAYKFYKQIL